MIDEATQREILLLTGVFWSGIFLASLLLYFLISRVFSARHYLKMRRETYPIMQELDGFQKVLLQEYPGLELEDLDFYEGVYLLSVRVKPEHLPWDLKAMQEKLPVLFQRMVAVNLLPFLKEAGDICRYCIWIYPPDNIAGRLMNL